MPKYNLMEDGVVYDTVECADLGEAIELADDVKDKSCYGDENFETFFVERGVVNIEDDDDSTTVTVRIDPTPPKCKKRALHDWAQPYEIVGGLKENPGVFGSGGGVKIQEVCMVCGCGKLTDTWGTNRANGTQGHIILRYTAKQFADEVEALKNADNTGTYRLCITIDVQADNAAEAYERVYDFMATLPVDGKSPFEGWESCDNDWFDPDGDALTAAQITSAREIFFDKKSQR